MTKKELSQLFRKWRKMARYTVKEVAEQLEQQYGIHIAVKTLYGYERGSNLPNVITFMALCQIYRLENLKLLCNLPSIDEREITLLHKYRKLDDKGKDWIEMILEHELERKQK